MGGVVVEDDVDRLVGGNLALDSVEKADEFDMAVALHAAADDCAVEHAECSEQGCGAVPLVIVRHGLAASGLDRQTGLGAIERLDLAFVIDRQHHGVGRRIDIEPTTSVSLAAKLGSRERLKVRSRCGCSLCACQMRCTEPSEMPMVLAIARPVQWVAWCGGSGQVSATTPAAVSAAIGALPGLRVLSRNTGDPALGKALLPSPHCRPAEADALRHPLRRVPIRRGEHNLRALDVFARPIAVRRYRCQLPALRGAQTTHTCCAMAPVPKCHRPCIAHIPMALVNLMNDSEH